MAGRTFWELLRRPLTGRAAPGPAPKDPVAEQRAETRWEGEGGAMETGPAQAEREGRPEGAVRDGESQD